MKKKIVSLALAVCLIAIAAVGTLAYFTDKDTETNTFTAGGVKIDLIEQQVNKEGTDLEAFKQNQVLMPIVGSAQGEKDALGQPVAKNYVDKIVTVENTGKSGAYVRAYFAIPSALDDGYETFNAGIEFGLQAPTHQFEQVELQLVIAQHLRRGARVDGIRHVFEHNRPCRCRKACDRRRTQVVGGLLHGFHL